MSTINNIQNKIASESITPVQTIRAFIDVTKPKILVMLTFTSLCAAFVAQRGVPSVLLLIPMLISASLSAGGAAAINMWYDRDIDRLMERTENRPIPAGLIEPNKVLWFGIFLGVLSVTVAYLWVNPLTSLLNAIGYIYYAVIYTMILKRRTPQNIVIGGGAGAFPILIGWASVTNNLNLTSWLMFLIIFLWTPPHSWALALYKNKEYTKAGIPMMPVVKGERSTKNQSLFYMILLFTCSIVLYIKGDLNNLYLAGAIIFNTILLFSTWKMWRENDGEYLWAKRTFICSLFYILGMFTMMVIGIL